MGLERVVQHYKRDRAVDFLRRTEQHGDLPSDPLYITFGNLTELVKAVNGATLSEQREWRQGLVPASTFFQEQRQPRSPLPVEYIQAILRGDQRAPQYLDVNDAPFLIDPRAYNAGQFQSLVHGLQAQRLGFSHFDRRVVGGFKKTEHHAVAVQFQKIEKRYQRLLREVNFVGNLVTLNSGIVFDSHATVDRYALLSRTKRALATIRRQEFLLQRELNRLRFPKAFVKRFMRADGRQSYARVFSLVPDSMPAVHAAMPLVDSMRASLTNSVVLEIPSMKNVYERTMLQWRDMKADFQARGLEGAIPRVAKLFGIQENRGNIYIDPKSTLLAHTALSFVSEQAGQKYQESLAYTKGAAPKFLHEAQLIKAQCVARKLEADIRMSDIMAPVWTILRVEQTRQNNKRRAANLQQIAKIPAYGYAE